MFKLLIVTRYQDNISTTVVEFDTYDEVVMIENKLKESPQGYIYETIRLFS